MEPILHFGRFKDNGKSFSPNLFGAAKTASTAQVMHGEYSLLRSFAVHTCEPYFLVEQRNLSFSLIHRINTRDKKAILWWTEVFVAAKNESLSVAKRRFSCG